MGHCTCVSLSHKNHFVDMQPQGTLRSYGYEVSCTASHYTSAKINGYPHLYENYRCASHSPGPTLYSTAICI